MTWPNIFRRRTTDNTQILGLILRAVADLGDKVDRLRREQKEIHDVQWKLWERTEEHFDKLHAAVKDSGPSQAADIAKVCLDRMAQVALRSSSPILPVAVEPRATTGVPFVDEEDDWAAGADIMDVKG